MDTGDGEKTTSRSPEQSSADDSEVGDALDIESALSDLPGADADIDETTATGQVTEAQKLPSSQVPDAYPVAIDGENAVGLRIRITVDRETMVYLGWPETYDESADLAVLLNNLGIAPDRFADIIGEEIDMVVIDGQWVPKVAAESARPHPATGSGEVPTLPDGEAGSDGPEVVMNDGTTAVIRDEDGTRVVSASKLNTESTSRSQTRSRSADATEEMETSPDYYYGVLGVGGLWTLVLFGLVTSIHILPTAVTGLLLLISPVAFPFLVYRDAEHVKANSQWSPHIAWTIGSVFWFINTFIFFAYVLKRRQAMRGD